jgi:hypothetical protein
MSQSRSSILAALLDRGFAGFASDDIGATIRELAERRP